MISWWHIVLLGLVVVVLFGGRGKISDVMGDFAKGIRSFREGLNAPEDPKTINAERSEDKKDTVSR
jgi:sec-independent protein translocase protein TatA